MHIDLLIITNIFRFEYPIAYKFDHTEDMSSLTRKLKFLTITTPKKKKQDKMDNYAWQCARAGPPLH